MIKHLRYDVGSIDAIVEFVKDNRKTLYEFQRDTKPFIRAIIQTMDLLQEDQYFYKSKLMFALKTFISF